MFSKADLRLEKKHTPCSFELIYFSDSKSMLPDGTSVAKARYRLGQSLAESESLDIK
jgi:glutamine phosphoribosylpyrophosphate amidotransferase